MDIVKTLQTALKDADANRGRSKQVALGASSVGGCRRQAWHILQQTPATNHDTENLAAIIGTAIHGAIFEAMKAADILGMILFSKKILRMNTLSVTAIFTRAKMKPFMTGNLQPLLNWQRVDCLQSNRKCRSISTQVLYLSNTR